MALDKTALKNGIQALMADMRTRDENADEEYATRLSELIDAYVKSGDGVYQTGRLQAGANVVIAVGAPAIKIV